MKRNGILKGLCMIALILGLVLNGGTVLFADKGGPSAFAVFDDFGDLTMDDVITNSTTHSSIEMSNIIIEFVDYTGDVEGGILIEFDKSGYVDQAYTITPPERVGKYVYIGSSPVVDGIYSDFNDVVRQLKYTNATIIVVALDAEGNTLTSVTLDGRDVDTEYILSPNDLSIPGYEPSDPNETTSITLTKSKTYETIAFYYDVEAAVIPTTSYTVEYYYDGVEDSSHTVVVTDQPVGSIVNAYTDKAKASYVLDHVSGLALTLDADPMNNVIKVYYVSNSSSGSSAGPKTGDNMASSLITQFALLGASGMLAMFGIVRRRAKNKK